MDEINLTFAELAFLVRQQAEDAAAVLAPFGVPDFGEDTETLSAGFASLVVRGLARLEEDGAAVVQPGLAAIASGCTAPTATLAMTRLSLDGTPDSVARIYQSDDVRFSTEPSRPLCFHFAGVDPSASWGALVASVVDDSIEEGGGLALSLTTGEDSFDALLQRVADGNVEVARDASETDARSIVAVDDLAAWLDGQLPVVASGAG